MKKYLDKFFYEKPGVTFLLIVYILPIIYFTKLIIESENKISPALFGRIFLVLYFSAASFICIKRLTGKKKYPFKDV